MNALPQEEEKITYRCDNTACESNAGDGNCNGEPLEGCDRTLGGEYGLQKPEALEQGLQDPLSTETHETDESVNPTEETGPPDDYEDAMLTDEEKAAIKEGERLYEEDVEKKADEAMEKEYQEHEAAEQSNLIHYPASERKPKPIKPQMELSNISEGAMAQTFKEFALDVVQTLENVKEKGNVAINITFEHVGVTRDLKRRVMIAYSIRAKGAGRQEENCTEYLVKATDSKSQKGTFIEVSEDAFGDKYLGITDAPDEDKENKEKPISGQMTWQVNNGGNVEIKATEESPADEVQPFTGEDEKQEDEQPMRDCQETHECNPDCRACDDGRDDHADDQAYVSRAQEQPEEPAAEDNDAVRPVNCKRCSRLIGHMDEEGNVKPEEGTEIYTCSNPNCKTHVCSYCIADGKCPDCGSVLTDPTASPILF